MAWKNPGIEKHPGTGGAAEILGMKRTTLYSRMRALGMSR